MEKNRKNIDDLFKKELGNYTETPPPAVWDALEKKLDGAKPPAPFTRFGYLAMVAGLVLISVFVTRSISGNSNITKNIAINNNLPKEQKAITSGSINGNTTTAPGNNQQAQPAGNENANQTAITDPNNNTQNKTGDNKNNPNHNSLSEYAATTSDNTNSASSNKKPQNKIATTNSNKRHHHTSPDSYPDAITKSKPGNSIADAGIQHTDNVFNSSAANTEIPLENKITDKDQTQEPDALVNHNPVDSSNKRTNTASNKKTNQKPPKPKFNRFEAGIKGGFESGFDNDASKKLVAAPYLQYNLSPKFSIMLQPAVKAANLSSRSIGGPNSYYEANNDGTLSTDNLGIVHIIGATDSLWKWNYSYTQTHDSIVKTYVTGGTYVEFELPVLLKYYITKQFSVYGGANIVYSKLTGITEDTYNSGPISITKTEIGYGKPYAPAPPPPEPLSITYTGTPYSAYTGPLYTAPTAGLLRFGYMLGFSYEFHKNWLFDALIEQSPVAPNTQAGYNVNTPVSAPYFRLTIGYKLIK